MTSDDRITVETDGESYADVRVDGVAVASVDMEGDDPERVSIKSIDPKHPQDAAQELRFVLPGKKEEYEQYVEAKRDAGEEPLSRYEWVQMKEETNGGEKA